MSNNETVEEWRAVADSDGNHEVSNCGRVRSLDHYVRCVTNGVEMKRLCKGKILRPGSNKQGYLSVVTGKQITRCVSELVMAAFSGPRPTNMDIAHNDGNPKNNNVNNLRYATRANNLHDMVYHGRTNISVENIHRIRNECINCEPGFKAKLREELGISKTMFYAIINRTSYWYV